MELMCISAFLPSWLHMESGFCTFGGSTMLWYEDDGAMWTDSQDHLLA